MKLIIAVSGAAGCSVCSDLALSMLSLLLQVKLDVGSQLQLMSPSAQFANTAEA